LLNSPAASVILLLGALASAKVMAIYACVSG
jgi:hypothetical protein